MQIEVFTSIFNRSIQFISSDWKKEYAELLNKEHWNLIGGRIFSFVFKNQIDHNPLPTFNEEIIADYPMQYQYFEKLKLIIKKTEKESVQLIAKAIEETPIEALLIILGQRKTPSTLSDKNGIPPIKEHLMASCFEPYNEYICKGTRAREKHISRNKERTIWGAIEGTPHEKEEVTKTTVKKIIEEKTWWNVYTHYKHDVVYEIRLVSGEGIRWKKNELELIGFLEPFI